MTACGWIRIKIQAFISKNALWKILMWSICILIRMQIQTFMKWSRSTQCVILHTIRWKVLPKSYDYVLYLVTWCPLLSRLFVNFSAFHFIVTDKMQITGRLTKPVFLNIGGMFYRFLTSIHNFYLSYHMCEVTLPWVNILRHSWELQIFLKWFRMHDWEIIVLFW